MFFMKQGFLVLVVILLLGYYTEYKAYRSLLDKQKRLEDKFGDVYWKCLDDHVAEYGLDLLVQSNLGAVEKSLTGKATV